MKFLLVIATLFTLSLANQILYVSKVHFKNLENLEFQLDENFVHEFLRKYEEGGDDDGITAIVNDYADKVFANIETLVVENNMDPMNITDFDEEFLTASIKLTNGKLHGISTISRAGDVTVTYYSSNKELELSIPIEFSNLSFDYDYHVIIILIGPKGSLVGKIDDFTMDMKLSFDFNTYHAAIEHVKTTNKGHVSLTFHGSGIVDSLVNILSEFVTTVLQPVIGVVIEALVSDAAKRIVDTINDTIDNILNPTISTTVKSLL